MRREWLLAVCVVLAAGVIATVSTTGRGGTNRVLPVTPTTPTTPTTSAPVGVSSTVAAGPTTATVSLAPGLAGSATHLAVKVPGVSAAAARAGTVTAAWQDGSTRHTTTLTYDSSTDLFLGSFVPPAGSYVPVDISANIAGRSWMLTSGLVVADGTGSFTGVGATALLDTNGDGKPDVFRVPVRVNVATAGTYQVAADLATSAGVALSAGGSAQLPAGAGVVNLDVPVRELLLTGVGGPFQVNTSVLTEGVATPRIVARKATVGTTGPFQVAQAPTAQVALSQPSPTSVDSSRDQRFDTLRFAGSVSVPAAGDYLVTARLLSPTRMVIGTFDKTVALPSGRPGYTVDFPGELVGATGSGRYTLAGLTIAQVENPRNTDRVHPVQTGLLDAAQWVGGTPNLITLQQMWKAAQDTGAVSPFDLYVSESNRLERVGRAITGGDVATARTLLATFIANVGSAAGVHPVWGSRLTGYATTLRASL